MRDLNNGVVLLPSALAASEAPVRSQYLGMLGRVLLLRYQRDGHKAPTSRRRLASSDERR
jgi:hypothetical protein